ncbi:hypothetical protein [Arthrobacter sp. CAN_C5]|uniref:hypothetical protein n=1 Tax=Arthrobacter sp. CAN_C5 TaxID=2760706 RepID=UPI001AE2FAA8|nr:hypothetical protein [Arthrobacter sp. CAN_C5]
MLSCAALIAVGGCSAGPDIDELPAPATLSAEPTDGAEPTEAAEPTVDPTSTEPAGTDPTTIAQPNTEYTPEELVAALTAVDEEQSLAGVILPDSDIRDLVDRAGTEAPSDLTVTPEECNVFADTDVVGPALSASLAVMTFAGASSLQPDSLSLTSHGSDDVIQDQLAANRSQLAECSEFEMDIAGEVVTAAVTEQRVTTNADRTFAVRTVVRIPGTIQETVSLTALIGTTTINVTVGSSGDNAEDLTRGEELVDATVAALRSLQ